MSSLLKNHCINNFGEKQLCHAKKQLFLHDTKPERCVAATEGEWRTNGSVTSAQVKHHSLCFFFEGDSPERMT